MSTYKFISYLLCNKGIIVNLYKLHFLSSHFSFQPYKRVIHPPTFSSLQPNTHEGKLNIFHPLTFPSSHNFSFFHFSIKPTKRTLRVDMMALPLQEPSTSTSNSLILMHNLLLTLLHPTINC